MDSLQAYGSSSEDEDPDAKRTEDNFVPVAKVTRANRQYLNPARSISLSTRTLVQQQKAHQNRQQSGDSRAGSGVKRKREDRLVMLSNNPKKDVLYEPVQGPMNDVGADSQRNLSRYQPKQMQANVALDEAAFNQQRIDFQRSGRAMPLVTLAGEEVESGGDGELLRTTMGYEQQRLTKFAKQQETRQAMVQQAYTRDKKKKDPLVLGDDDEVEFGVWGPQSREESFWNENKLTSAEKGELAPEQLAEREYITERNRVRGQEEEDKPVMTLDRILERKMAHLLPPQQGADAKPFEATTEFHGAAEYDYQGRSWMAPPPGAASSANISSDGNLKCFVPKRCVARFGNNKNGIHRIRMFPKTGHLLLSAGLDGVCQVWSIPMDQEKQQQQPKLMRTYKGHSAACRDVQFNLSGSQFVSASFDRYLRLWDTESGEVKRTFGNGKVPYCVQFYPRDDTYFVVGCSDNRIVTYNTETGDLTQEYNHHLAPVNAIVFISYDGEDGAQSNEPVKMVTSSDDKKVLVWEWDIGVPIKYISDPTMHSMPCLSMHPTGQFICGQSLDNTICCIQTSPKIRVSHNKKFSGHVIAGYACEVAFSPDGRFVLSGDGSGSLFIWDWKRHKILQKYRAHESGKPTICVAWHPFQSSTVFTCSWDGVIKMWR